jgi:membrane fusion protein, multidrug efflux system
MVGERLDQRELAGDGNGTLPPGSVPDREAKAPPIARRRTPRRWVAIGGVLAVLIAGGVGASMLADDDDGDTTDEVVAELATTTIERRDLVIYDEIAATLGYTETVDVEAIVDGTLTSVVGEGARIDAGTVVATIDGEPMVALIGDVPAWRELFEDVEPGADVWQLEVNLVALGFDPNHEIDIDEEFDDATREAVERWEESIGVEVDGVVEIARIVFVPGSLLVDTVAVEAGAATRAGTALLQGRLVERRFLVPSVVDDGGVVVNTAAVGAQVTTGTELFRVDHVAAVAVVADPAATIAPARDLSTSADDGPDVRVLEEFLVGQDYDPDGAVVVDETFDDATATAVVRWQQSLGLLPGDATVDPDDVIVPAGSLVVVPAGLSVSSVEAATDSVLSGDALVLTLGAPTRLVISTTEVGDSRLVVASEVDIELPDDTTIVGTVTEVGDVATPDPNDPEAPPVVDVEIGLGGEIPPEFDDLVELPVTLLVVDDAADDVLTVPTSALVSLAGGGYAVEVVTGRAADGTALTQLVAVDPGIFADGLVEVEGEGLEPGLEVVVPS